MEVEGGFDNAMKMVLDVVERKKGLVYPMNSVNPVRLEGQKTIAYEIVEELGVPQYVIVPVGNAGNISAIWKGFKELWEWGYIEELPVMVGVQAEGAAPIYRMWAEGRETLTPIREPRTIASAIRIGSPVNWVKALKALKESRGFMTVVSDDEILEAVVELARRVGLGVEPSSAAPYAAWKKLVMEGRIGGGDHVVLVATGHALKDPGIIEHLRVERLQASTVEDLVEITESLVGDEGA